MGGPVMYQSTRVLRGGSWIGGTRRVRCASHRANSPRYRLLIYGFRPVVKAKGKP